MKAVSVPSISHSYTDVTMAMTCLSETLDCLVNN